MTIEFSEVNGKECIVVPEGIRPYTEKDLTRDRNFLAAIFKSAWRGRIIEEIPQISQEYGRDVSLTETAYLRIMRTIELNSPFKIMNALHLEFRSPRTESGN